MAEENKQKIPTLPRTFIVTALVEEGYITDEMIKSVLLHPRERDNWPEFLAIQVTEIK